MQDDTGTFYFLFVLIKINIQNFWMRHHFINIQRCKLFEMPPKKSNIGRSIRCAQPLSAIRDTETFEDIETHIEAN